MAQENTDSLSYLSFVFKYNLKNFKFLHDFILTQLWMIFYCVLKMRKAPRLICLLF